MQPISSVVVINTEQDRMGDGEFNLVLLYSDRRQNDSQQAGGGQKDTEQAGHSSKGTVREETALKVVWNHTKYLRKSYNFSSLKHAPALD